MNSVGLMKDRAKVTPNVLIVSYVNQIVAVKKTNLMGRSVVKSLSLVVLTIQERTHAVAAWTSVMLIRESAVSIATAWEIFNVAPTIVVGQMKLIVALTHLMMEVNFWYTQLYGGYFSHCHSQITILVAKILIPGSIMYRTWIPFFFFIRVRHVIYFYFSSLQKKWIENFVSSDIWLVIAFWQYAKIATCIKNCHIGML